MSNKNDRAHEEILFKDYVAIDNDECFLQITGIDPDDSYYYNIKVLVKNKSKDKTYTFVVNRGSVNGLECYPSFEETVYAGKKAIGKIGFSRSHFKGYEIGDYTDVEFIFEVYYEDDVISEETIHVYPYGKDQAIKYNRKLAANDKVLVDNDHVTVVAIGGGWEDSGDFFVELMLCNKTDKYISFYAENGSVNDFMVNTYTCADPVGPGHSAFGTVSWRKDDLAECEIEEVDEVQFIIQACAEDDCDVDFVNQKVTLIP